METLKPESMSQIMDRLSKKYTIKDNVETFDEFIQHHTHDQIMELIESSFVEYQKQKEHIGKT